MSNPISSGVTVAFAVATFMLGFQLGYIIEFEVNPPLTCEVATTKIWATQQCLKFQPGCKINKGPELFAEYKQMKDFVAEHCPDSTGDFPLDLSQ